MSAVPTAVQLVALDLDGTVVAKDLSISPAVLDVIHTAHDRGIITTLVTGRMYEATKPFITRLSITAPVVCYQGAGIYDALTGEAYFEEPVPAELTQRVVRFARERGLHIQLYGDNAYYVDRQTEFGDVYAFVSGVQPHVVGDVAELFANRPSVKIVVVTTAGEADAITQALRALVGAAGYVTRSNPEFVEVMAPAVDKGRALHFVASRLGISPEHTLAVGDSWNDIPLLKAAAFGVAMGSAPEEAKAVAQAVVADVGGDGVVEAYERFVFPYASAAVPS